VNINVFYTTKYPVTYWQTEGTNYSFTLSTQSQCNTTMFIYTFFSFLFFLQLPILFWQKQGFGMAKAKEVLDLEAPEGN
jgi:hypothetical protein